MHLREHEETLRTIRRHITPFILMLVKILIVSVPAYAIALFIGQYLGAKFSVISILIISVFVGFFITYIAITYILDRLVITNQRVVFINWKSFWRREEFETELKDIQDIRSREKGFLASFRFLDYGLVEIETASSSTTVIFDNAPDPEGIRSYLSQLIRSGKMKNDDSTPKPGEEIPGGEIHGGKVAGKPKA